jgi:hypothetical protein
MDASSTLLGVNSSPVHLTQKPPIQSRALSIAISIIAGIGALVVGVALGACLGVATVHTITLIVAGCGFYFLFVKILSTALFPEASPSLSPQVAASINPTEVMTSKLIYGKDAWKALGVEIVDKIPEPPSGQNDIDPFFKKPFSENYIDFYIPEKIRFRGIKRDLTFYTLEEISGKEFESSELEIGKGLRLLLDGKKIPSGWRRMCTKNVPGSKSSDGTIRKEVLNANQNFKLPCSIEAAVLNLFLEVNAEEYISEESPFSGTWCEEVMRVFNESSPMYEYPILVGRNNPNSLQVHYSLRTSCETVEIGINPVQRFLKFIEKS